MRIKEEIRRYIWDLMLKEGVATFPLPPHNRIPNFIGADEAARKLLSMEFFMESKVIKVNPDSPQRPVRLLALSMGKVVVMPTPRISKGFLLLDPRKIPRNRLPEASTIKGAFRWGRVVDPWNLPKIDLIIVGSVAVDLWGNRLGKGEGYSELEYGILRSLNKVTDQTPIVTTVHDLQVLSGRIPRDPWDVTVDYIVTPTRILKARERYRPKGIIWELLSEEKLREIPILMKVKKYLEKGLH